MNESPSLPVVRKRSWFRFRLITLLIFAPLAAIGLSMAFRHWYADYLQDRAIAEIERLEGWVMRDEHQEVVRVEFVGKKINDAQLDALIPYLAALPKLKSIVLASNDISDEGLQHLARLPQLETAVLADTKVTPEGIAQLQQRLPTLTIDMTPPHMKAMLLASRPIFKRATLSLAARSGKLFGGSGDGSLRIWNLAAKHDYHSFRAHDEWTFAVALHPTQPWLATAGGDNLIKLWDLPTRQEIRRFVGHDDDVHAIAFTPDGRTLVSTGDDHTVRIWNVASAQSQHVLPGHGDTIPGLAISHDGQLAASASRDGTVRLWNLARGECVGVLRGHADDVMAVDFHPQRLELASASYDRSVIVWDLDTLKPSQVLRGHTDWAFSVAYSPDGRQLASAAGDGVRLFNATTGKLAWHTTNQKNVSHVHWLTATRLATASADSSVVVQESTRGRVVATFWPTFTSRQTREGDQLANEIRAVYPLVSNN